MMLDLGPLGNQGKYLIQDPSEEECLRLQEQSLCMGCRLSDGSCAMCFGGGRRDLQGVILDGTLRGARICVGSLLAGGQTCGIPLATNLLSTFAENPGGRRRGRVSDTCHYVKPHCHTDYTPQAQLETPKSRKETSQKFLLNGSFHSIFKNVSSFFLEHRWPVQITTPGHCYSMS